MHKKTGLAISPLPLFPRNNVFDGKNRRNVTNRLSSSCKMSSERTTDRIQCSCWFMMHLWVAFCIMELADQSLHYIMGSLNYKQLDIAAVQCFNYQTKQSLNQFKFDGIELINHSSCLVETSFHTRKEVISKLDLTSR